MKKLLFWLICIGLIGFVGYKAYESNSAGDWRNDLTYKELAIKNESYNGKYTLTKLDDKGRNTWDGWVMWVENDVIIAATYVNADTVFETEERTGQKPTGDSVDELSDFLWQWTELEKYPATIGDKVFYMNDTGTSSNGKDVVFTTGAWHIFLKTGKLEDDRMQMEYKDLKKYGLIAAYDENSKELWLSKLVGNSLSEYHSGYTLQHWNEKNSYNCLIHTHEPSAVLEMLNDLGYKQ